MRIFIEIRRSWSSKTVTVFYLNMNFSLLWHTYFYIYKYINLCEAFLSYSYAQGLYFLFLQSFQVFFNTIFSFYQSINVQKMISFFRDPFLMFCLAIEEMRDFHLCLEDTKGLVVRNKQNCLNQYHSCEENRVCVWMKWQPVYFLF